MKTLVAAFVACVAASGAVAQSVPYYPVDSNCVVEWPNDHQMQNYCVGQQQKAYNTLKANWYGYNDSIRQKCLSEWDREQDYTMILYCINQQTSAANNKSTFQR